MLNVNQRFEGSFGSGGVAIAASVYDRSERAFNFNGRIAIKKRPPTSSRMSSFKPFLAVTSPANLLSEDVNSLLFFTTWLGHAMAVAALVGSESPWIGRFPERIALDRSEIRAGKPTATLSGSPEVQTRSDINPGGSSRSVGEPTHNAKLFPVGHNFLSAKQATGRGRLWTGLLGLLLLVGCSEDPLRQTPPTVAYDGCQYIASRSYMGYYVLTHKGNCTNEIHKDWQHGYVAGYQQACKRWLESSTNFQETGR